MKPSKEWVDFFDPSLDRTWIPTTWYGQMLYGFTDQFLYYFIVCANMRAVAIGLKVATVSTDVLITLQGFIGHKVSIDRTEARTWWVGAGQSIGGGLGSILSIWVTQRIFGR